MLLTSKDLFIQAAQRALRRARAGAGKNLNRQNVTLIQAKRADRAFVAFAVLRQWSLLANRAGVKLLLS